MGRGGEGRGGWGGEGRVGEGAHKVLQPAQSVRLRASIKQICTHPTPGGPASRGGWG